MQTPFLDSKLPSNPHRGQDRSIYLALIGVGVILTLFFGLRVLHMAPNLRGLRPGPPPVGAAAIEEWMTVPHVAHLTHVPEGHLWQQVGLSPLGNRRHSLEQIQEARAKTMQDPPPILPLLQQAVETFQSDHPSGGPLP